MNEAGVEQWLSVPGYEGRYEVSSLGGVRSLGWLRSDGHHYMKPRVLKPFIDRTGTGYLYVQLTMHGRTTKLAVHLLVLAAFRGPAPAAGMQGCHGDGCRTNARLDNLRWDTPKGNSADMVAHGTRLRGERTSTAKLTEAQALQILQDKRSSLKLAPIIGVASSTIRAVRLGQNWKHLERST
jgi:hypothetical protein